MHNNTKYIDGKVLILQQKQPYRQSLRFQTYIK